jgi:enoyl-CoA hydratase/carnithine racemase
MLAPGGAPGEPDILGSPPRRGSTRRSRASSGFAIWRSVPAVVVAGVKGTRSSRVPLALAADLGMLADDARPAWRPARARPGPRGTGPLVHLVGYARLEICATGRLVGAREASDLGLATVVVPGDDPESTADLVAALLATPRVRSGR